MPITPQTIKVEITPKGDRPVLYFAQYDNGRPFICELYWEGEAYEPTDDVIELHVRKVDGNLVSIEPDSVTANSVQFFTTEQLCACFGKNIGTLVLKAGDDAVIASKDIDIIVQRDVFQGGIQSDSAISNLTTQIEQITEEVIGENYYNKEEIDNKFDDLDIPTKTSDLENDSGFITASDIPTIPTKTSQLTNDSGFITASDIPTIPTKTSQLQNDSGFTTIDDSVTANYKTWSSDKISDELYDLLPVGNVSGYNANFNTALSNPFINISADDATKIYKRGANIWDEEWTPGDIQAGTPQPSTTAFRSANYIECAPNTKYTYVANDYSVTFIFEYGSDKTYLSKVNNVSSTHTFTTGPNTHYLLFTCRNSNTYSNDISIRGDLISIYVPYNDNSTEYDISDIDIILPFVGVNNIFPDIGQISLSYKDTIQNYIDTRINTLSSPSLSMMRTIANNVLDERRTLEPIERGDNNDENER